jgi:pimeloyl-ACP methyl ester carboxylesterase
MQNSFRILGRVFPTPTARVAYKLWVQTRRCPASSREKALLAKASYQRLSIGTREFETYVWGKQGPKVLLVHGWNGRGSTMGHFVEPLLDAGYQVVLFDAPAHGRSPGDNSSSLIEFTDAILKTDEVLGPFDSVVSFSVGGLCTIIALKLGLKSVGRVVCINSPCHIDYILNSYFANMLCIPKKVMTKVCRLFEDEYGKDLWTRFDAREYVKDYTIPALIFHDQDDRSIAIEQGETTAKLWPGALFIKTTTLGHTRAIREPHVIDQAVEFMR